MFLWIIVTVTLLIIQNLIMNIRNTNKSWDAFGKGYDEGWKDGYTSGFECAEGGGEV